MNGDFSDAKEKNQKKLEEETRSFWFIQEEISHVAQMASISFRKL